MKSLLTSLLFAVCTGFATAATPGSYAPVTFSLTWTEAGPTSEKTVKNGATETTFTLQKSAINNKAILLEAQRLSLIAPGPLTGWSIVAVADADAFWWFYARNSKTGQTVRLDEIVDFVPRTEVYSGKFVRPAGGGPLTSGKLKWSGVGTLYIGNVAGLAGFSGTDTIKKTPLLGDVVWASGAVGSLGVLAYGEDGHLTGKITFGAAKVLADVEAMFPDVDD